MHILILKHTRNVTSMGVRCLNTLEDLALSTYQTLISWLSPIDLKLKTCLNTFQNQDLHASLEVLRHPVGLGLSCLTSGINSNMSGLTFYFLLQN